MTTINNINSKSRALSAEEINAFGAELDALRKETMASLGKKEADYIYGVRNFVRYTDIAGRSSNSSLAPSRSCWMPTTKGAWTRCS